MAQQKRAEEMLAAAIRTANQLTFDLAPRLRERGVPEDAIKDLLERARALQQQLIESGQAPCPQRSSCSR